MRRALLSATAPLLVVLTIGVMRLREPPSAEPIRVGLAAHDQLVPHFEATTQEEVLPVVEATILATEALVAQGASIVVLPEKLMGVGVASSDTIHALLQDAAERTDVALLAGLNRAGAAGRANIAVLFRPAGGTAVQYTKRHLVPGLEAGYAIGTSDATVPHAGTRLGIAICKDLDFHSLGQTSPNRLS